MKLATKDKVFKRVVFKGPKRAIGEFKEGEAEKVKEERIKKAIRGDKVETTFPERDVAALREELRAYAPLVSKGSYIVVQDGCMEWAAGAPRSQPDWAWNNPLQAMREFVAECADFSVEEPAFAFNEGNVDRRVTYWPKGYLRRR